MARWEAPLTPQALLLLQIARRWLWLFLVAALLAAAASYLYSSRLPKVYQGTVKLSVTPGQAAVGASSYNDILTAERLGRTYAEVLKTWPIVEAAAQQAGIAAGYEEAVRLLDVRPLRDTQLIQVRARAGDPELAARFANQVAAMLIRETQASQSSRFAASKENLGKQVEQLAADIAERSRQVEALRGQPPGTARDGELARLQAELAQLQQSHGTAVRSYEEVRLAEARSTDLLTVIEPARPPRTPVLPRVKQNVLLAAVAGLVVAMGVAVLVEYLDDRLFSPERLQRFTGLQLLGTVPVLPKDAATTVRQLSAPAPPLPAAGRNGRISKRNGRYDGVAGLEESFRLLQANLQFAAVDRPLRTLLVTSCDAGDGKSTTAANLAVVWAQAGQQVLLIDADLRRPSQHTLLGVPNRVGLTSLLVDEKAPATRAIQPAQVDGLWLLTSGPLPPNPSELLASVRMQTRLAELIDSFDRVIVDSPPVVAASDPAVLAGLADGTIVVVNAQRARSRHVVPAVATLQKAGARVLGAVLNRLPRRGAPDYIAYGSYGVYGRSGDPSPAQDAEPGPSQTHVAEHAPSDRGTATPAVNGWPAKLALSAPQPAPSAAPPPGGD